MCFQCRSLGALAPLCCELHPSLFHADFVPAVIKPHLIDHAAEAYLAPALDALARVAGVQLRAIKVDSDGSCLPYAVSRCLVGMEVLYDALRLQLVAELEGNREWYRATFAQGMDDAEFAAHFAALVDEAMPTHGQRTGRWLGPGEHLTAMANVLCRPVLLLDADMRQPLVSGLHLPLRRSREDVAAAHPAGFPSTLVIGWASAARNHFISLVQVQRDAAALTREPAWAAVEKRAYGSAGRTVTCEVRVPLNHRAGGRCMLRDEELGTDVFVDVPLDKRPGDVFTATVPRAAAPFEAALLTLCSGNGPTALTRALKTLAQILDNLADASFSGSRDKLAKTGRLRLDNAHVYSNLLTPPGALEVLLACGFERQGGELVFTQLVDEKFILARDAVAALLLQPPSPPNGELRAGMEPELFGPSPCVGALSWEDARERYGGDGAEAGKKAAECRRASGVWTLGAGRAVRTDVTALVDGMKACFAQLTAPTDIGAVAWDDEAAYDFKLKEAPCAQCGALNLWEGAIDGPAAEAHTQACKQCEAKLASELSGARRMLHFVGEASKPAGGEFGTAARCERCGRWRLSKLGCACS